jgi:hypothetical protein
LAQASGGLAVAVGDGDGDGVGVADGDPHVEETANTIRRMAPRRPLLLTDDFSMARASTY